MCTKKQLLELKLILVNSPNFNIAFKKLFNIALKKRFKKRIVENHQKIYIQSLFRLSKLPSKIILTKNSLEERKNIFHII